MLNFSPFLPTQPVKWSPEGLPVFTTDQLEWALPEDYGWARYLVIEGPPVYEASFFQELCTAEQIRLIHRYCRRERFKFTLSHLMAHAGRIPVKVVDTLIEEGPNFANLTLPARWESCRRILKQHKLRLYYNRIPCFLADLGLLGPPPSPAVAAHIMSDFDAINMLWPFAGSQLRGGRKYFPSLRYIATRLMQAYGVSHAHAIPLARTPRIRAALDETFHTLACAAKLRLSPAHKSLLDLLTASSCLSQITIALLDAEQPLLPCHASLLNLLTPPPAC